jgi:hypothetical protein
MFSEIKAAGLIRVIRLVRLLKLLKLAKQPRIMAKLRQFVTMPIKQQTLIKYFFIIFFIIHWTACTLRLLTSFAVGDCRPKGSDMHSGLPFDDECARTYLNTNRRWGQGPWSQYASAIIWSIGAMSGEAYLPANMEETVLNTLVMLMGIVVMAFLVGELSNILGNFDPVGNEFEQTVLTAASRGLPAALRHRRASSPGEKAVGGRFSNFEAVLSARRSTTSTRTSRATSTRRCSDSS